VKGTRLYQRRTIVRKPKIGILTFSDGREYAHNALLGMNQRFLDRVVSEIKKTGEVDLVVGEEKMKETSNEWPQGFVKLGVRPGELISEYGSNHAHAVFGNWVEDLVQMSDVLNIEYKVY
jgi:hypothetical protein